MPVGPSDLRAIPLFQNITDDHLRHLMDAFERLFLAAGHVLFEAGSEPTHLLLLVSGEVALKDGAETRFRLTPLAPIGELGAVTRLPRNTTAVVTAPSEVWRIGVGPLTEFFEKNGDVAFPFYHNLLNVVAEKVRRDGPRLDEMRSNLIRTQKAMKRLLDLVLETEETPLSKTLCSTLEDLIEHNRRGHYMVEPAHALACNVRLDAGVSVPVRAMSEGWLRLGPLPAGTEVGAAMSGVLVLPAAEIPVSGAVDSVLGGEVLLKLDLLIDQYARTLGEHLTRVQMLDFVA
jgi:CRP/FNR family transcriptional regulator, cyclic AMP receptor protein